MQFAFLVFILSSALACKRIHTVNPIDSNKNVRCKLMDVFFDNYLFIPTEIFVLIFSHLFDSIKTAKARKDPLHYYRYVSSHWRFALTTPEFQTLTRSHPRSALILLKKTYLVRKNFNLDLLKACKTLIDVDSARKILVNTSSSGVFAHLSDGLCLEPGQTPAQFPGSTHF